MVAPAVEFKSLSLSILEYLEVSVFIVEDVHVSLFTGLGDRCGRRGRRVIFIVAAAFIVQVTL